MWGSFSRPETPELADFVKLARTNQKNEHKGSGAGGYGGDLKAQCVKCGICHNVLIKFHNVLITVMYNAMTIRLVFSLH